MKSLSWSRGAREEKAKSGFSPGLSTAAFAVAAVWTRRGGVAKGGGTSAMAKGGGEFLGDAWKPPGAGGGAGRRPRAAAGGVALSAVRSRETERGRRQGPKRNFQNFRDLNVNKQ